MRSTQTYILRLLVDTTEPNSLRGSIQSVEQAIPLAFCDQQALLTSLYLLISQLQEVGTPDQAPHHAAAGEMDDG